MIFFEEFVLANSSVASLTGATKTVIRLGAVISSLLRNCYNNSCGLGLLASVLQSHHTRVPNVKIGVMIDLYVQ